MKNKTLLISIHDVTPLFETEIDVFVSELKKRGISKFSLLVTPNWDSKWNLSKYPLFVKKLKKLEEEGAELILHGRTHADRYNTPMKRMKQELETAKKQWIDVFKKNPITKNSIGFIPPCWNLSNLGKKLILKNFKFTENLVYLYFRNRKIFSLPIGMESYASNKFFYWDILSPKVTKMYSYLLAWVYFFTGGVVRYTLHPRELHNNNFLATLHLLDKFLKKKWKTIVYSDITN